MPEGITYHDGAFWHKFDNGKISGAYNLSFNLVGVGDPPELIRYLRAISEQWGGDVAGWGIVEVREFLQNNPDQFIEITEEMLPND